MKKSFAFLTLAAMSLALSACGGSSDKKEPEKKAESSKKKKKKGAKEVPHENPWAIETQGADAAKAEAKPEKKKKKKKKGKEEEQTNPWAKDSPTPPAGE